ncbi:MAG TPA: fibronectin type III domain-containing protein [Actinomycetota bacterium]|nr:fibronectin type III domain-containing protein [Actinomycetota bacterium]
MVTDDGDGSPSMLGDLLSVLRSRKASAAAFGGSVLASLVATELSPLVGRFVRWALWLAALGTGAALVVVATRRARRIRPGQSVVRDDEPKRPRDADRSETDARPPRRLATSWGSVVLVSVLVVGGLTVVSVTTDPLADQARSPVEEDDPAPADALPAPAIGGIHRLWANDVTPTSVELAWDAFGDVDAYEVVVDGETVELPGWRDAYSFSARPGTTYFVRVSAFEDGNYLDSVQEYIDTPGSLTHADARLQGDWVLALRTADVGGTYPRSRIGERWQDRWSFVPSCGAGACDVYFDFNLVREAAAILRRDGSSYSGSKTARLRNCAGEPPAPTFATLRLSVVDAGNDGDEWVATRIRGRLSHEDRPYRGCGGGSMTHVFTGRPAG